MNVLDIFYNEIIKEAAYGRVDCSFMFNIAFTTIIEGKVATTNQINNTSILMPTLIIKNKSQFDNLLEKYVKIALEFYSGIYGLTYEVDPKNYIKSLITLLWSDATSVDYSNPELYIMKKIKFLTDETFKDEKLKEPIETSLGNLEYSVKKDQVFNETPYYIEFKINDNPLPVVRFGISNNVAYIYAIQNTQEQSRDKKLNRALYKVNEGLPNEVNDNIKSPENITGVTPSTLVSATLFLSLFTSLGINSFIIPTMLPTRWNAKEIMFDIKANFMKEKGKSEQDINEMLKTSKEEHIRIQRNLSDKFIRTFRRLEYHFKNINITAYPFIDDIDMHIEVSDYLECNNPLLEELYNTFQKSRKLK